MPKKQKSDETFDVRVLQHRIRRGVLKPAVYQTFLDGLPDDAEHGEESTTRFTNAYQTRDTEGEA